MTILQENNTNLGLKRCSIVKNTCCIGWWYCTPLIPAERNLVWKTKTKTKHILLFQRTVVPFLVRILSTSHPPVTKALGNEAPSSGLQWHPHTYVYVHMHTNIKHKSDKTKFYNNKKKTTTNSKSGLPLQKFIMESSKALNTETPLN